MKEQINAIWNGLPKPIKEYAHTMLVGAGIGALTAGTAKIFQKLNVQHPAEPVKPQYQPKAQYQGYQQHRNWAQGERQRGYYNSNGKGGGHGR